MNGFALNGPRIEIKHRSLPRHQSLSMGYRPYQVIYQETSAIYLNQTVDLNVLTLVVLVKQTVKRRISLLSCFG